MAGPIAQATFSDIHPETLTEKGRRKQGGLPTTDVVVSAHVGSNDGIFPEILRLHVPEGAVVADITFGRGVFWKSVPPDRYKLLATDIKLGTDWRQLPYASQYIDAVIFDPPYMEGFYRSDKESLAGNGTHSAFQEAYSDSEASAVSEWLRE